MKCVVCGQRKGKRSCPAKGGSICPTCCGSKRIIEIGCPHTCPYLSAGQRYQAAIGNRRFYRSLDPIRQFEFSRLISEHADIITEMELAISSQRSMFPRMTDAQVQEALASLLKSYDTELKGIIYQPRSNQLEVQTIVDVLRELIEHYRNAPDLGHKRMALRDAIDCLNLVKARVEFYSAESGSPTGYLDLITQLSLEARPGLLSRGPRVIIP